MSPIESLLDRDGDLPGLRLLFEPGQLHAALTQQLGERVDSVTIRYLRYQPNTKCLAAVKVTSGNFSHEGYLKCYRRSDEARWGKVTERFEKVGSASRTRLLFPDHAAELLWFPEDDRIGHLARLMDEDYRAALLERISPGMAPTGTAKLETLNYKPERRYVGAVMRNNIPAATLKVYTDVAFSDAITRARTLRDSVTGHFPALLGRSKSRQLLLFEWIPGDVLVGKLATADAALAVEESGRALARLHQSPLLPLRKIGWGDQMFAWSAARNFLAFILPDATSRLRSLDQALQNSSFDDAGPQALLHGDFYAKQVLITGQGARFVDFDEAAIGHPLFDIANFCAHLETASLRDRLSANQRDQATEALLSGYGHRAWSAQLNLVTALRLLVNTPHFFRSKADDWVGVTYRALDRANQLLEASGKRTVVRDSIQPGDSFDDPELPVLAAALNPAHAEAELQKQAGPNRTLRLMRTHLLRHKPGRRALVEYSGEITDAAGTSEPFTWLGKIRARGLDHRTANLTGLLRLQGFDSAAADEISVPDVIGKLEKLHLWLQTRESGRPLTELLDTDAGITGCQRAAEALNKLHRSSVRPQRQHGVADELQILVKSLDEAQSRLPAFAPAIRQIKAASKGIAQSLAAEETTTLIHRDFYPDQLLVDGSRVTLVDLDLCAVGDPHLDAGNFIAHLVEHGIRFHGTSSALNEHILAFRNRWLELTPSGSTQRLHGWTTLALARHIWLSTKFNDRRHTTESLLTLCRRRLAIDMPVFV